MPQYSSKNPKNSNDMCIVRNPATEAIVAQYPYFTLEQINHKIEQSEKAWKEWKNSSWETRRECVKKLAASLRSHISECAKLITLEMGKPITQAEQEIEKCATLCDYYAEHAENLLKPRLITHEKEDYNQKSYIVYDPLGIIYGIMPWNFPFWQVMRFAIPSIMAGNTALLKHSPNVTGCSLEIEKLFKNSFPEHVFTSLVMQVEHSEHVVNHRAVAAISVTGSDKTGRIVSAQAGQALKKTVLELGGSDPYIVLEDADIEKTAKTIVAGRISNAGQSCVAPKRILAVDAIREALQAHVTALMKDYSWGNPADKLVKLGPLARKDLRDHLHKQIVDTVVQGAGVECGGFMPEGMGYFYPPTVLVDVPKDTPAYDEELFGPVLSFIPVKDEAEAIKIANGTRFGLSSAIFTKDIKRAEKIARQLMAGGVFINKCTVSDPRMPFGGIKDSGHGRELNGDGIHEFTNIKTIVIAK